MYEELFEIADGKVVSFNGKTKKIDTLEIPARVTEIGPEAFRFAEFRRVRFLGDVETVGSFAFAECHFLESVEMRGVKNIELCAFSGCENLRHVLIPDGTEKIEKQAFSFDRSLGKTRIPKSVKSIDPSAFIGTGRSFKISVDEENKTYSSAGGHLCSKDGKTLVCGRSGLKRVAVPRGVERIGPSAFYLGSALRVKIPEGVTEIGPGAFHSCRNLRSVRLPDTLEYIDKMAFAICEDLEEAIIPEGTKRIGDNAFALCKSLKRTSIPSTATSIGQFAFTDCRSLESVDVAGGNGRYRSIDGNLYSVCEDGLVLEAYASGKREKSFVVPEGVREIADEGVGFCMPFESATIPDGAGEICGHLFCSCEALKSVTIPRSVKKIGDGAFSRCGALEAVYYSGTKEEWDAIAVGHDNARLKKAAVCFCLET